MSEKLGSVVETRVIRAPGGWRTSTYEGCGTPCLIVPIPEIEADDPEIGRRLRSSLCHEVLRRMECDITTGRAIYCRAPAHYTPPDVELPDGWEWAGEKRTPQNGELCWCEAERRFVFIAPGMNYLGIAHILKQVPKES